MRRALASLLLSISLVLATVSWSGFILGRTVFDPGRSDRLADELLENEEVRGVIVRRLADTINASVPAEVPITDAQLEQTATTVLDDPRVEALLKEQLVSAHQNALDGVDEPLVVDATVIGQASRDALIAQQPALALLPEVPVAEVTLPTTGFAWIGTINGYVRQATWTSGLFAIAGIGTSLVISNRRSKILRRLAYWAFSASAFWIIAAFVAPWVLGVVSPESMILASAAINVFFGAMIKPAIAMAVFGCILYGISVFLPRYNKQRAAERVTPSRRSRVAAQRYRSEQPRSDRYQPDPYQAEQPRSDRYQAEQPRRPTQRAQAAPEQPEATYPTNLSEPDYRPTAPPYAEWDENSPTVRQPRI